MRSYPCQFKAEIIILGTGKSDLYFWYMIYQNTESESYIFVNKSVLGEAQFWFRWIKS